MLILLHSTYVSFLDWIILSPFFRYIAGYLIHYNNMLPGMLYIIIIFCWVCNPKRLWSVFLILTLLCTKLWDMKEGKKNCTKISNTKKTSNVWSTRWQNLINELYNATWKLVYNVFPPIHLPTSHLTPKPNPKLCPFVMDSFLELSNIYTIYTIENKTFIWGHSTLFACLMNSLFNGRYLCFVE